MYILYLYVIFICHISFYCIYRHYMSQRQTTFQFIHHVMLNVAIKLYYYSHIQDIFTIKMIDYV